MGYKIRFLKSFIPIIFILFSVMLIYYFGTFTIKVYNPETESSLSIKKIAVIFPASYQAEKQAANFICKAANNIGVECGVFNYMLGIATQITYKYFVWIFKPDLVIDYGSEASFFNKKGDYKVLGIANADRVYLFQDKKWMDSYDALLVSGKDSSWLGVENKKIIEFYNSPPKTNANFEYRIRTHLFYPGSNWDLSTRGSKHYQDIFLLLDQKSYFQVYGHKNSWNFLKNSYKGLDYSLEGFLDKMKKAGVSLVLEYKEQVKNNNPASLRVFEAARAGNVIIANKMKFYEEEFKDCIFFIDPSKNPQEVVNDIDKIMSWVSENPELANQKAKCAFDIFYKKYSMEEQIKHIVNSISNID